MLARLAALLDEAVVVFVWVASAVERDISTASIRQGRDSIQRAVKRPETV